MLSVSTCISNVPNVGTHIINTYLTIIISGTVPKVYITALYF